MFQPENALERSLIEAAADPGHRPRFYRDLLASEIFVVNAGGQPPDVRDGVLQEGARIQLQSWQRDGETWLAIFSSLTRLEQSLRSEATYLQLGARSFFEITRGANVVLNPNLEYGKEFTVAEIAAMLDGSLFRADQGYTVERETEILIGQPADYPTGLVNALCGLFSRLGEVRAAYLAHFFDPERDEHPHTLIGIDAEEDWQTIVGEAGMVAREVMPAGEIVDFVRVSEGQGDVSRYMLEETEPFYRRPSPRGLAG